MLRLVLIGGLLVVAFWLLSYRRADALGRARRRRALGGMLAVGALLLLWRAGLPGLAAVGAAGLAVLRVLAPWLLRALPWFAHRFGPQPPGGGNAGAAKGPGSGPARGGRMTRAQALEVLGLQSGATHDEITAQYRKLIQQVHPDRGGSQFLTQQLNQARDVLLHS